MKKKITFILIAALAAICLLAACDTATTVDPPVQTQFRIQYADRNEIHSLTVSKGELYAIEEIPQREGYDFAGLFDSETGGTQYVNEAGVSVSPFTDNRDITLYVQFRPKKIRIVFDYCGAQTQPEQWRDVEYGAVISQLPLNVFKDNVEFAGWFTRPECKGVQVTDAFGFIGGMEIFNYENYETTQDPSQGNEQVRLYAGYNSRLVFNSNGASAVQDIVAPVGQYVSLPVPTMQGMAFKGWYDDMGKLFSGGTMPEESKYLTAVWEEPGTEVVEFERKSSKNDCGYDLSNPETNTDWTSRHNGWELGEILVSGVVRNELNQYSVPVDGDISMSYRLLVDIGALPKNSSNIATLSLGSDSWTGRVSGTSISGSAIGEGAYWVEVTYTDGTSEEEWRTNFLYGKNKGDEIEIVLPDGVKTKKVSDVELRIVYELYCDGPGVLGFYWKEYPNWNILAELKFI